MGRLNGKVAVITGAARGMGAAHARLFVAEGAKVVLTDIRDAEGKAVAKELGTNARFLHHDVTKSGEWERVISEAEATFGPVSVLVNNAGIAPHVALPDISEAEYIKVIDVNQVSVFLGMKTVLPSMRRAGGGSIVNISSSAGLIGYPNMTAYVASKFAVRGMTKTAAVELARKGIRVNSVHPGAVWTPLAEESQGKDLIDRVCKEKVPLGRVGDPKEVSYLVLFLASDESSYCTGAEFVVDGGLTAQ
jgi:3alpha(or 20beta)-hydroxysteroid dehydrogenase